MERVDCPVACERMPAMPEPTTLKFIVAVTPSISRVEFSPLMPIIALLESYAVCVDLLAFFRKLPQNTVIFPPET